MWHHIDRHLILKGILPFSVQWLTSAFLAWTYNTWGYAANSWVWTCTYKPVSVFHIDTVIMIFNFQLLRKPPHWICDPSLRHFHPSAASQHSSWHRTHLAAHFNMCRQVFLSAKSLGTGRAGMPSLFGVHGGQVPVQICAVSEVFQTAHTLHQLLLEVDGLLVPVCIGFEGEAGRALWAEVARWRRLGHCRAVERLVKVERLGLWLVTRLVKMVVWALNAWPVQGQGHQRQGLAVLVFPEMLQAAEQPFAQGAGKPLWGRGTGLWHDSFPWSSFFAQHHQPFSPSASHEHWRRHSQATSTAPFGHLIPLDRRLVTFQCWESEKESESESEQKIWYKRNQLITLSRRDIYLSPEPYLRYILSCLLCLLHHPVSTKHPVMSHAQFIQSVWNDVWACSRQTGETSCEDNFLFTHVRNNQRNKDAKTEKWKHEE